MALTSITATTGVHATGGGLLARNGAVTLDTNNVSSAAAACIHGSCLVSDGFEFQAISNLKPNDTILCADGRLCPVEAILQCWLKVPTDVDTHECILFETGSLGENLPSHPFVIDTGHPMCLPEEFARNGIEALKPARSYLNSAGQLLRWGHIEALLPLHPTTRYDLILSKDSCGVYIANGLCVKGRKSTQEPGYNHLQ